MNANNIHVGLCGWGDHDTLYTQGVKARDKLAVYASHFPIVEIDSSFYAILPQKNYEAWARETPDSFRFVVKPHQGMTGHQRGSQEQGDRTELFRRFEESIQPLVASNKLKMILFQYPPWFDCKREHVNYIRYCVQHFSRYPVAVELRHQSWFEESLRDKTLAFLREVGAIHVVCDEPQIGTGCVPIVAETTSSKLSLVRFHGRNKAGWRDPGQGQNWRDVRYLYRYSQEELMEWTPYIKKLASESQEVCILFNNNSGGDAADNAAQFMKLLGIEATGLHPRQIELF
ncbi:DUF72 domain-containing protein [Brevibacillus sp. SYSU BS000544]|uniref:DUF72 domain-containing protein n=1 Tax=Brevibacillus sp. SYSU BS000544 TaxID=3416443 RepID=UPI003CE46B71